MKTSSLAQRSAKVVNAPEDAFEELRAEFHERLKAERTRFLALSAALRDEKAGRSNILQELRTRAHRLSGTAAIFEVTGVAVLARALELAVEGVCGKSESGSQNSDRVMCAALLALIQVIGSLGSVVSPSKSTPVLRARGAVTGPRRAH